MTSPADPAAIAQDLIRCRSVTPEEGGALGLLAGVLAGAGFRVERLRFTEPGTPDVENLYARIGSTAPNLVFAGHTDVVPAGTEAEWRHPPFAGEIAQGEIWGRGAVDMKGAIACFVAAALAHVARHNGPRQGSLSLLITGDEEGPAINGTPKLLAWAAERGETFDCCLVGEPSSDAAVGDMVKIGRRGSLNGTLTVTGRQGHVAYPQRADNPIRGIVTLMSQLMAEPLDRGTAHFEPSNLEFTSVDVGNRTVNLIPAEARARFNIRYNDSHGQESLKRLIETRTSRAARQDIRWRLDFEPSNSDVFITEPGPFVDLVAGAVAEVAGRRPVLSTTGGTSDARFIRKICPVVELGLVGRLAHHVDERAPLADLDTLTRIYGRIIAACLGEPA
jgi:succinyl-diaminopimelate desuccinylase